MVLGPRPAGVISLRIFFVLFSLHAIIIVIISRWRVLPDGEDNVPDFDLFDESIPTIGANRTKQSTSTVVSQDMKSQ